jgi:hypothetical protein
MAFGLNIGNVGRIQTPRPSTEVLLDNWNKRLLSSREVRLAFVGAYYHTGNYVLEAPQSERLERIVETLTRYVPWHKFAVFHYAEFVTVLKPIRLELKRAPSTVPGRRWTSGIVMDVNPNGRIPPTPSSDEKAWFGAFAVPRIRIAWKGDVLNAQGNTLDNTQREGGWGSLSERMKKVAGGLWTARSLKSVEGIVAVAESFGGRVP